MRWLTSLATVRADLALAARSLWRSPVFAVTAIVSLALAVGASAAAFSVIDAVRFRALPFRDGDRLVLLSELPIAAVPSEERTGCRSACDVGYESYDQRLRTHPFRTLDAVAAYTSGAKALATKGEPLLVSGGVVSQNLFALLGARPLLGRAFTPEDDKLGAAPVTILSHDLWSRHFGEDPAILGRVVKLSDTQYTVIGVMPAGFAHEVDSKFWLPAVPTLDPSTRPSIRTLTVIGQLAPGRTVDQLRAELSTIEPVVPAAQPGRGDAPLLRFAAQPLRKRYAESTQSHDLIFGAIVACVLLIACANLANLVLVRTLHQQRELAIRAALGGGVARLTRHVLAQNLVVVCCATLLGIWLAHASLRVLDGATVLESLRPAGMEYRIDWRVTLFATTLALAAGALLSVIPARLVARVDAQQLLRAGAPGAGGGRWGRRAQQLFVVAQIASAVVLLTGAALMAKSVTYLSRLDLGFDPNYLVQGAPSYPHPWRVKEKFVPLTLRIRDELAAIPGVRSAALRATTPLGPRGSSPVITPDGAATPLAAPLTPASAIAVSPGYFDALGVRVVRGRAFTDADSDGGIAVAMVNEWAARRWWGASDPVGRSIRVDTAPSLAATLTIVGVVRDNKAAQGNVLLAEDGAELYRPYVQAPSAFPTFIVRGAVEPSALLKPMRELFVREVPDRPVFASAVMEGIGEQLRGVRLNAYQILGFALVGLLLAVLGIHGVLAYTVGLRTREIGIRGALGATRGRVRGMILRDALGLTAAGVLAGLVAASLSTPLIAALLHGTSAKDPTVYASVALGVAMVALVASWLPARRASRVDPIVALRSL